MPVEIYSTDTDAGAISVIAESDGAYTHVRTIEVGNAPRGAVKFTGDGRGYVSNCGGDTISEIDLRSRRETARIKVGVAPRGIGILPGDRYALVSSSGENCVCVVDLATRREIDRVAVGRDPRHMAIAADGRSAYVAVWGSDYVARLDTSGLGPGGRGGEAPVREAARIPVGKGAYPYSVALRPGADELYVANTQAPYASVISTAEDEVLGEVTLPHKGGRAIAFSPDGDIAYISVEDISEIAVVDASSRRVVRTITVGPGPRGIALDPSGTTIYASAFARTQPAIGILEFTPNALTVVRLAERGLQEADAQAYDEIVVGAGPCSVAVRETKARRPRSTAG